MLSQQFIDSPPGCSTGSCQICDCIDTTLSLCRCFIECIPWASWMLPSQLWLHWAYWQNLDAFYLYYMYYSIWQYWADDWWWLPDWDKPLSPTRCGRPSAWLHWCHTICTEWEWRTASHKRLEVDCDHASTLCLKKNAPTLKRYS